jgi:thiol-disulfide isomerase/thioredoxin
MSLTANPFFVLFLTIPLCAIAFGAVAKSLWWRDRQSAAVVTICLCILAVTAIAYRTVPDWLDRRAFQFVDEALPPFSIQTLDGEKRTSDEFRGRVVVLSFWATWCLPCQAELPRIQAVSQRYRANPKVSILAIDSGTEGDTVQKVRSYLLRRQLDIPVLIDSVEGNATGSAAKSVGLPSLPALYVIDARGRLRRIHLGYEASEDLEASLSRQIDRLL